MNVRPLYWTLPGAFAQQYWTALSEKDLLPLQNDFKISPTMYCLCMAIKTPGCLQNIAFGTKMLVNAASIKADTLHGADHQIPWKNRDALKEFYSDFINYSANCFLYNASWIFGRTFMFSSFWLSPPLGFTLLLKNTKMSCCSGSAQTQVPVKPVWPNVCAEADKQG